MKQRDPSPAKKLQKSLAERLTLWKGLEKRLRGNRVVAFAPAEGPAEKTRANPRRLSLLDIFKLRAGSASPSTILIRGPEAGSQPRRKLRDATVLFRASISSSSLSMPGLDTSGFEPIWGKSDDWSGQVLAGRFLLERLIAQGGMSRVFRAIDRKERKRVAVKILPPFASEVVRESRAVTRELDHPAILKVLRVGSTGDGGIFEVLPLIDGLPLRQLLDAGAPRQAMLLAFRRACEGVAHAHAQGVLHRDLKPSNILVERNARAFVTDWDLALAVGTKGSGRDVVVGTPLYMAPEQFQGKRLDPSADVYALGLILYEILTGVHPREGGDDLEQIAYLATRESPPPPSFFNPKTPPELEKVILRCLSKKPSERFPGAAELLEALEEAGET